MRCFCYLDVIVSRQADIRKMPLVMDMKAETVMELDCISLGFLLPLHIKLKSSLRSNRLERASNEFTLCLAFKCHTLRVGEFKRGNVHSSTAVFHC